MLVLISRRDGYKPARTVDFCSSLSFQVHFGHRSVKVYVVFSKKIKAQKLKSTGVSAVEVGETHQFLADAADVYIRFSKPLGYGALALKV